MSNRSRRTQGALLSLPLAVLLALVMSGQAAAVSYTHHTGTVGQWTFDETFDNPLVLCKYGPTSDGNHYSMTRIKVAPPMVYAVDSNPAKEDKGTVSWQFQVQRKYYSASRWKTVASSAVQKRSALDDAAALFSTLTVKRNGHEAKDDPSWLMRVQVIVKWYKPGGAVEGTVTFRPSYYRFSTPDFSSTSSEQWCQEVVTNG